MKKTLPVLATLVALGLGATMAQARSPERPAMPTFEQLDTGKSGSVTLQDFQAYFETRIGDREDAAIAKLMERAGEDGKLDEAGLRAGLEAMRTERREAMGERMFSRIDTNKDGSVDAAEYEAFTTRIAERMEKRGEGRGFWRN